MTDGTRQDTPSTAIDRWIDRLSMRTALSSADIEALRALPGDPRRVEANRDFVRLGEVATHACLVVSGMVGRFSQTASGQRQIVSLHIPGDMVDLHSVAIPRASSALQALTATQLLRVPHGVLTGVADARPKVARAFWTDCVADAMILAEWVQSIGRRSARGRLSHLLCELAIRNALIGHDPTYFAMPATQLQLADLSGLTSVHVNRTMRKLTTDGVVNLADRHVRVRDWAGMVHVAEFDPAYMHIPAARLDPILARLATLGERGNV